MGSFATASTCNVETSCNKIKNACLESKSDPWRSYGKGKRVWVGNEGHSGTHSLEIENNATGENSGWRYPAIKLENPMKTITFGGWSKAKNVSNDALYVLDFKVVFADNTYKWYYSDFRFSKGTHDWEHKEIKKTFSKKVKEIVPYALLYRGTGTVWFDDIYVVANSAPVANAGEDQTVRLGDKVALDGSKSSDEDGDIVEYKWTDGNQTWNGERPVISDLSAGRHIITLKVTDNCGATSEDNVTITVISTPPICIEALKYSTYGKIKIGACFNAKGIFKGGAGCRQVVKLRNLSNDTITHNKIDMDIGEAGDKCGIDGEDQTGKKCSVSTKYTEYDPMSDFKPLEAHTIYVDGFDMSIASTEPTLNISYEEKGKFYQGKIEKCVVNAPQRKDLCISKTEIKTHGFGICMKFGDFFSGGGATGGCETRVTLHNPGDSNITNISTEVVTDSLFDGSMIDKCGVNGGDGNCTAQDVSDFGFMHMGGMFFGRGVSYDPVSDIGPDGNATTFTNSLMGVQLFNNVQYFATYIKDGQIYGGKIGMCDRNQPPLPNLNGYFDALDTFRWNSTHLSDKHISTKVAGKSFKLKIVSLKDENNTEPKPGIDIRYNLFDFDSITYLDSWKTFDASNITTDYNSTDISAGAYDNVRVAFEICADFDINDSNMKLYPHDKCTKTCPNDNPYYDGNMDPCWRHFPSSDNFAIRPDHFKIDSVSTSKTTAGSIFEMKAKAVDASGKQIYNYNKSLYFNSNRSPNLKYKEVKANCNTGILKGSTTNSKFVNGVADINLTYNEVGNLNMILSEVKDSDFAHTDSNDTDFNSTIHDSAFDTKNKANPVVYREITPAASNIKFIVDHFNIENATLHDHHESSDANFTYLANSGLLHTRIDSNMSATLNLDILAKDANNATTKNYTDQCYANDLNLTIDYLINDEVASSGIAESGANPGNLNNIIYRWNDDNDSSSYLSSKGEGNATLDSNFTVNNVKKVVFNNDHNGSAKLKVLLNFDRRFNAPVNPFKFHIDNIKISDGISQGQGKLSKDHNATFLYARAKPSKYFYDDVDTDSIKTPVFIWVYQGPDSTVDLDYPATKEFGWYLSNYHENNVSHSDGNLSLMIHNSSDAEVKNFSEIDDGKAKDVNVTAKSSVRPLIVDINLTGSDNSLIYNKETDKEPTSFFKVKFIGSGDWSGTGKTGHVVGSKISKKKSHRVEW